MNNEIPIEHKRVNNKKKMIDFLNVDDIWIYINNDVIFNV